ncbi:MAG: hypothetical protein K2X29_06170, partial [Candidatus Obscuribacterales bacterium]|nr:hypothetical protein [Candidatus Obscuribacterales bacterium]
HTVPVPHWGYGALVIKDSYLIGLYTGIYAGRPGHTPLPQKLYRSVWVSALQDIENIRKEPTPPSAEELAAEAQEKASAAAAAQKAAAEASQAVGRYICANCHARNVEFGNCRSCGIDMEEAALGEDPVEKLENARRLRESSQSKVGLHPGALVMLPLSVAIIGLVLFFAYGAFTSPHPATSQNNNRQPAVAQASQPTNHNNGIIQEASTEQAIAPEISMESLISQSGLKATPISDYSFEDTSFRTEPMPSFGMISQDQNQKILFTIWGNNQPLQNLDTVAKQVPFANFQKVSNLQSVQVGRGQVTIGGKNMDWFVGRYPRKGGGNEMAMVCAYKAPSGGKTVVVVARPYQSGQDLDYMKSLTTINNMVSSQVAGSQNTR